MDIVKILARGRKLLVEPIIRQKVENHTSSDSLSSDESGSIHTNYGASGAITLTLPSTGAVGTYFEFGAAVAYALNIKVGAAGHIIIINGATNTDDGGADGKIWADDEGESVKLELVESGVWLASYAVGTWTWEQP